MGFTFLFLRKLLFNFKIHFFDCLKIKKSVPMTWDAFYTQMKHELNYFMLG